MEMIPLTKGNYELWDEFCLQSNDAWFWHTTDWLEYTLNYKPQLKTQNLSFLVYKENKVVAVVPLMLEVHQAGGDDIREFSFSGGAIPAAALDNALSEIKRGLVYEFIFDQLDRLAYQNKVARVVLMLNPLSPSFLNQGIPFNYLMQFGYMDISLNTQLIDLRKSENELWDNLRRNHRRNIKKGDGFKVFVYRSKNITKDTFNRYKETHHKAAGRQTRPDKTFELMYDWLIQDLGFLVVVEFEDRQVSFEYYSVYKNNVYGTSAANDPDYKHLPLRHLLEWEAILWMKRQHFSFYEIGLQQYGILPYDFPGKKQLNISHFKKGFGGFTVPFFIGEKFYSLEYYKKIDCARKQKFLNLNDKVGICDTEEPVRSSFKPEIEPEETADALSEKEIKQ